MKERHFNLVGAADRLGMQVSTLVVQIKEGKLKAITGPRGFQMISESAIENYKRDHKRGLGYYRGK